MLSWTMGSISVISIDRCDIVVAEKKIKYAFEAKGILHLELTHSFENMETYIVSAFGTNDTYVSLTRTRRNFKIIAIIFAVYRWNISRLSSAHVIYHTRTIVD